MEILRYCLAAVFVSIAADVVYALNPSFGALLHYFPELPGNWLLALEFRECGILRDLFVDAFYEPVSFPAKAGSDLFPNVYVVKAS